MRTIIIAIALLTLLSAPALAQRVPPPRWELWTGSAWVPYPRRPPTDGNHASVDVHGYRLCTGELRRYVVTRAHKIGDQCAFTEHYTYYCRRAEGPRHRLSPQQAPACGPTRACQ